MIEVTKYTPTNNENGSIIAFVSFKIPNLGLHLNDCRLIRSRNGGFFIGFPGKKYENDGETKYAPYYYFEGDLKDRFQKQAREAIDKWVKENTEDK